MRRLFAHRPPVAIVISLLALFVAMGGTAVAATGGTFILGKSNAATSVSSLNNSKGTALSLSSSTNQPPLRVSNSVQVPNLNASELGGHLPKAFLPVGGTAVNSNKLGGQPASDYMTGTSQIAFDTATVASGNAANVNVPGTVSNLYGLKLECLDGIGALGVITATGATLQFWALTPESPSETSDRLVPGPGFAFAGTTTAATWVVQVEIGSIVATTDWSAVVNASGSCAYAAQTITNG